MSNEFDIPKAKTSVKDLAVKVKKLKIQKNTLRDKIRDEVLAPPGTWCGVPGKRLTYDDAYQGSGSKRVRLYEHEKTLDWETIVGKLKTRRECSRSWNLAYAFARGVPYKVVERKTELPTGYLEIGIAVCLAQVTLIPGMQLDQDTRYFQTSGEQRAYLEDLKHRVSVWFAVPAVEIAEAA